MTSEKRYVRWSDSEYPLEQDNEAELPGGLQTPGILPVNVFHIDDMTKIEFIRMLSALQAGAEMLYPDNTHELTDRFLCGLICPPELTEETDNCIVYPIYSPFIDYHPYNPFNGDEVPSGYLTPPFTIHDGGGQLPPAYLAGDLIVPYTAINLVDYTVFGTPISIEITVTGSGQIEIDLLSLPLGGIAVLKVGNNPPNAFDIIAGIFDPNTETLIDLSLDTTSAPPEDDIISSQEIDIVAAPGVQSKVWIMFIPVVDIDLIPLRFGGGLRSVQLCGFEEQATAMGITDIRFTGSMLEYFKDGVWSPVDLVIKNCTDVENCLTTSPTVANIQSQISSNDGDIAALQAVDINLQAQISSNDSDIAAVVAVNNTQTTNITTAQNKANLAYDWTQVNSSRISSNDNDIYNLQLADVSHQAQISSNDSDIADLQNEVNDLLDAQDIDRQLLAALYECTGCDWEVEFNFALASYAQYFALVVGEYTGQYYQVDSAQNGRIEIKLVVANDFEITGATFFYSVASSGSFNPTISYHNVPQTFAASYGGFTLDQDNTTYLAAPANSIDNVIAFVVAHHTGSQSPDGSAKLYKLRINGTGAIPDEFLPYLR